MCIYIYIYTYVYYIQYVYIYIYIHIGHTFHRGHHPMCRPWRGGETPGTLGRSSRMRHVMEEDNKTRTGA